MARDGRARPVALTFAALLVLALGVALGMWVQYARGPSGDAVRLSAADIGFAQDMSMHHEQAIQLAQTLTRDCDPQVGVLADRIVAAQSAEIATMHGWLTLFDKPFTSAHPMQWMDGDMHDDTRDRGGPPMPGMASVDEITRLAGLRGVDAEVWFLQLMIRHHEGGVAMARSAVESVAAEPIRRMARGIVADQGNEIGVMTAMLTVRHAEMVPYP